MADPWRVSELASVRETDPMPELKTPHYPGQRHPDAPGGAGCGSVSPPLRAPAYVQCRHLTLEIEYKLTTAIIFSASITGMHGAQQYKYVHCKPQNSAAMGTQIWPASRQSDQTGRRVPCVAIHWPTLPGGTQRLFLWLIATIVATLAALAGCSNRDCAYYGGADANTRCVVVGPAPIGAGP